MRRLVDDFGSIILGDPRFGLVLLALGVLLGLTAFAAGRWSMGREIDRRRARVARRIRQFERAEAGELIERPAPLPGQRKASR